MKKIIVLGSTGSIGRQTLDIARLHNMKVTALSANNHLDLLERQAREFLPQYACIAREELLPDLKIRLADTPVKAVGGASGLRGIAALPGNILLNAVVGSAGLPPTLAAIEAGNDAALANKETLVAGGEIVMKRAAEKGVKILPVDSEHSAIFQCLDKHGNPPEKIILTASGGAFRGYTKERLKTVTREQALKHPNWDMGRKVTADSATMMNKGLELIEAMRLFHVSEAQVEIVVHPQSIVHSAVEFADGSIVAQLGTPDMRLPIQYALTYPERLESSVRRLSLTEISALTFEKADEEVFVCLALARRAARLGGNAPCALNCANEIAVGRFLRGEIGFGDISEVVGEAFAKTALTRDISLEIIEQTEREIREVMG